MITHKTTPGFNAETTVAKNLAYTANSTYKDFVESDSPEGQIGIFNAATGALITGAIAAGTRFFFAQKRDLGTFKTSAHVYDKAAIKKIAYTAPVKQVSTVTFTAFTPAVNDELSVSIIETTPGNQPFPRWTYSVQAKAAETRAQLLARLTALINDASASSNLGRGLVVTAVLTTDSLALTAVDFGASFRIALQEKAYDVASAAVTTAFKQGSGYFSHIKELELQGQIFDGVTTQYPIQNATNAEFGAPSNFTTAGVTYHVYQISAVRRASSPIPQGENVHNHNFLLAVPVPVGALAADLAASSPDLAVATALGF